MEHMKLYFTKSFTRKTRILPLLYSMIQWGIQDFPGGGAHPLDPPMTSATFQPHNTWHKIISYTIKIWSLFRDTNTSSKVTNYFVKQECIKVGCLGVSAQGGVCPGGCLPRGVSAWGVSATHTHTPCEQNHRRLWKHNLAATTLRTVQSFIWLLDVTEPSNMVLQKKKSDRWGRYIRITLRWNETAYTGTDLRGLYGPKCSQFHAIIWKIWQNCMLAPPGRLASPLTENPGSTTGIYFVDWISPIYLHLGEFLRNNLLGVSAD